jgi:hypothetical protein
MAEKSFAEVFLSLAAAHLGLGIPNDLSGNNGIGVAPFGGCFQDQEAVTPGNNVLADKSVDQDQGNGRSGKGYVFGAHGPNSKIS